MFSRGRITLPREVCREMGVGPGDVLEFETDGDGCLVRAVNPRGSRRDSSLRSE
jgi:bifunctional DNA-binding transcriptional regulator/antitoxin component of YhaV-PrlF toxin-antitoxin module